MTTTAELSTTTTTTVPASDCATLPVGPTFASIACRLAALRERVRSEAGLAALTQFGHRPAELPARKKLDPALRRGLVDDGDPIRDDLRTLRAVVACPDDAPPE